MNSTANSSIEALFFSLEVDSVDTKGHSKPVSACAVFAPKTLYPIVFAKSTPDSLSLDDVYSLALTLTDRFEGQLSFSEPPMVDVHHKERFMYAHIDIGSVSQLDIEPILVEFERVCELFGNTAQMKAGVRAQQLIAQRQEFFWERKKLITNDTQLPATSGALMNSLPLGSSTPKSKASKSKPR